MKRKRLSVVQIVAGLKQAEPQTYLKDGALRPPTHIVFENLDGLNGSGSLTVTLSGDAAYANDSSHACTANDRTSGTVLRVDITSGTQFTISGGGASDNVTRMCGHGISHLTSHLIRRTVCASRRRAQAS